MATEKQIAEGVRQAEQELQLQAEVDGELAISDVSAGGRVAIEGEVSLRELVRVVLDSALGDDLK